MFHKDISEENKERLIKILDLIKDCLVKEEYKYSKNPGQIRRTTDINREPINLISFGINKEGTRFRISVEILD